MAGEVTDLLLRWSDGDEQALDSLVPVIYQELRRLAHRHMRKERAGHTLQTTALAHEAYMKLVDQNRVKWQNRAHFLAVCSKLMRRILIDYARTRGAARRQGEQRKVSLDEAAELPAAGSESLLAIDEALKRLEDIDARKSRVVELRFFGGLTIEETAEVMGASHATVERDWTTARAWLYREINRSSG
ncbi:MAG: sigma-70 family RNA polymerase sigma factor [Blastocatellia bacterium]